MGHHVLPGNPPIPVHLKRSARARRISLRVSGLDGRVVLTAPPNVREAEVLAFAHEKADWIRSHLQQQPDVVQIGHGVTLPVEGVPRQIEPVAGRRVILGAETLGVPGPEDRVAARLAAWLRELARDRLVAASDHYAQKLGRGYGGVTLRDARSRWGSCSSRGGLMYSWRLVLAPPPVLAYVAAHEVAHLAQMNHSPAFWNTVTQLYGPYETQRKWLRSHGNQLHRYRFGD